MLTLNNLNRFAVNNFFNYLINCLVILSSFKLFINFQGYSLESFTEYLSYLSYGLLTYLVVKVIFNPKTDQGKFIVFGQGLSLLLLLNQYFIEIINKYIPELSHQLLYNLVFIASQGLFIGINLPGFHNNNKSQNINLSENIYPSLRKDVFKALTFLSLSLCNLATTIILIIIFFSIRLCINVKGETVDTARLDFTDKIPSQNNLNVFESIKSFFKLVKNQKSRLFYLFLASMLIGNYLNIAYRIFAYNTDFNFAYLIFTITLFYAGVLFSKLLKMYVLSNLFNFFANLQKLYMFMAVFVLGIFGLMPGYTIGVGLGSLDNFNSILLGIVLFFVPGLTAGLLFGQNYLHRLKFSRQNKYLLALIFIILGLISGFKRGINLYNLVGAMFHFSCIKYGIIILSNAFIAISLKSAWNKKPRPQIPNLVITYLALYLISFAANAKHIKQIKPANLKYYNEASNAVISVDKSNNLTILKLDDKVQATLPINLSKPYYGSDIQSQVLLGLLPLIISPENTKNAFVIGYGSGKTVEAMSKSKLLKKITVCDINDKLFELNNYFKTDSNNNTLIDKNNSDARFYLETTKQNYNLIVSQPCQIASLDSINLFSQDFWQIAKSKLTPNGLFCQWIQLYEISPENLACLLTTFQKVFPNTFAFHFNDSGELILIGFKNQAAKIDVTSYIDKISTKSVQNELIPLDLCGTKKLFLSLLMTPDDLQNFTRALNPYNRLINDNNLLIYKDSQGLIDNNLILLADKAKLTLKPFITVSRYQTYDYYFQLIMSLLQSKFYDTCNNLSDNDLNFNIKYKNQVNLEKINNELNNKIYFSLVDSLPNDMLFKSIKSLIKDPSQDISSPKNPYINIWLINSKLRAKNFIKAKYYIDYFNNYFLNRNYNDLSQDITDLFNQAYFRYAWLTKQFELAIKQLDLANFDKLSNYKYKSLCLFKLKRYNDAIELLAQSLSLYPNDFDLRIIYSFALFSINNYNEAFCQLQYAHITRPDNAEPFILATLMYTKINNNLGAKNNLNYLRQKFSRINYINKLQQEILNPDQNWLDCQLNKIIEANNID